MTEEVHLAAARFTCQDSRTHCEPMPKTPRLFSCGNFLAFQQLYSRLQATTIALEPVNLFSDLVSKVVLHEPILYSFLSVGQGKIVDTKTQEALQAYRKFGVVEANSVFLPLFQIKQDSNARKTISMSEYPGLPCPLAGRAITSMSYRPSSTMLRTQTALLGPT